MTTIQILGITAIGLVAAHELWRVYYRLHTLEVHMTALLTAIEKAAKKQMNGQ